MFAEARNASFLMEGGNITNNISTESSGGGIFIWQGRASILGGRISENRASEIGGICLRGSNASLSIGGDVQIINNTSKNKSASNLSHETLDKNKEFAIFQVKELGENAKIGIFGSGKVVKSADGYEIKDSDIKKYASDKNLRVYRKDSSIMMDSSSVPNNTNDHNHSNHSNDSNDSNYSPSSPSEGRAKNSVIKNAKEDEKKQGQFQIILGQYSMY